MSNVLQVEYSPSMLDVRRQILEEQGYGVISILSMEDALDPTLLRQSIGVIVIGHGASLSDRVQLISYFRQTLPGIPIVALVRKSDQGFTGADFNCPGDNPPLWLRTVQDALARSINPADRR